MMSKFWYSKYMIIHSNKKDEIIDITEDIEREIKEKEIKNGACLVFAKHTTCCITTADLDPGTDLDFLEAIRKILPKINYRHPHDPSHTPDHILSSIIGPSVVMPVKNTKLSLGTWQRIVLVELDGPRDREVDVIFTH